MIRLFFVLAALLIPAVGAAQCAGPSFLGQMSDEDRAELTALAEATPYGTGLMWEATRNGKRLTIIGTMHLPDPRHAALLDRVAPLWETADVLLVEATYEDQAAMQAFMASDPSVMVITEGPTLPERLDPDVWAAIAQAAADRNVPGFMAAKMQPWFLTMTLSVPPCAMAALASAQTGLDGMLMNEASARDILVASLEPWQSMFALLSSGTFDEQIAALEMSLLDVPTHEAITVALKDLYFAETTAQVWHITQFTRDLIPDMDDATFEAQLAELEKALLVDRNADWIPVITEATAANDHVVAAFGAAHLIKDTGVLALLEADGWTITHF